MFYLGNGGAPPWLRRPPQREFRAGAEASESPRCGAPPCTPSSRGCCPSTAPPGVCTAEKSAKLVFESPKICRTQTKKTVCATGCLHNKKSAKLDLKSPKKLTYTDSKNRLRHRVSAQQKKSAKLVLKNQKNCRTQTWKTVCVTGCLHNKKSAKSVLKSPKICRGTDNKNHLRHRVSAQQKNPPN